MFFKDKIKIYDYTKSNDKWSLVTRYWIKKGKKIFIDNLIDIKKESFPFLDEAKCFPTYYFFYKEGGGFWIFSENFEKVILQYVQSATIFDNWLIHFVDTPYKWLVDDNDNPILSNPTSEWVINYKGDIIIWLSKNIQVKDRDQKSNSPISFSVTDFSWNTFMVNDRGEKI